MNPKIQNFVPENARERHVVSICKMKDPLGSEHGTCKCRGPMDCELILLQDIKDELSADQSVGQGTRSTG